MNYQSLTPSNKIADIRRADGYNGSTVDVSVHLVNGTYYHKAPCGCFPVASPFEAQVIEAPK